MARISAHDPPERLAEINFQQFYNLVDADLRRKLDSEVAQKLRHPAVAIRWHQVLVQMRRNTEGSIAARSSEFKLQKLEIRDDNELTDTEKVEELRQAEIEYEEWRVSALRFKSSVEEKLTEAQWARHLAARSLVDSAALEERTMLVLEVAHLRDAITRHRSEIDPQDASDVDQELWAALDGESIPPGAKTSIGQEVRRLLGGGNGNG